MTTDNLTPELIVTACEPCGKFWPSWREGPKVGEPCPECGQSVKERKALESIPPIGMLEFVADETVGEHFFMKLSDGRILPVSKLRVVVRNDSEAAIVIGNEFEPKGVAEGWCQPLKRAP